MKADAVLALVRAHVNNDTERFKAMALSIAANAEGTAPKVAKSIRSIIDQATAARAIVLPHGTDELLAPRLPPDARMSDLVLEDWTRSRIERVLVEQRSREQLTEHGLRPMRKLLFTGPPGVGKTMTASVIAGELALPMIRVELHGVLAQYMGETGKNLAKVFAAIRQRRGVYLFDEFDGLATQRSSGASEVSEMRRVVSSLLQMIEADDSESIIIGATNHVGLVDVAMFRRFDEVIEFPLPSNEAVEALIRSRLLWADAIEWSKVHSACNLAVGHADLVAACDRVNKDAVLAGRNAIETDALVQAIYSRRVTERAA